MRAALSIRHPYCAEPSATVPLRNAVQHALDDLVVSVQHRCRVDKAIQALAAAPDDENETIIKYCAAPVAAVLRAFSSPNHVALMRELQLVAQLQVAAAPCGLVLGLPMLGHAASVRGFLRRDHAPTSSRKEWLVQRTVRNSTVLESIRSCNDEALDTAAFAKSIDEKARGVLLCPSRPTPTSASGQPPWYPVGGYGSCTGVKLSHRVGSLMT